LNRDAYAVALQQHLVGRGFRYIAGASQDTWPASVMVLVRNRLLARDLIYIVLADPADPAAALFHADRFLEVVRYVRPRRISPRRLNVRLVYVADGPPPEPVWSGPGGLAEHFTHWPFRTRSGGLVWVDATNGELREVGSTDEVFRGPFDADWRGRVAEVDCAAAHAASQVEATRTVEFINHLRRQGPRAIVTQVLLVIIALAFIGVSVSAFHNARREQPIMALVTGADVLTLLDWGADFGLFVNEGQLWRLVTSIFLHAGGVHLFLNSFALVMIGPMVERYFGRRRYLTLFLTTGVAGSVASLIFSGGTVSVGASGALFGLVGALVAGLVTQREHLPRHVYVSLLRNLIPVIVGNIILGFSIAGIDNAAHLGGLICGLCLGAVLANRPGDTRRLGLWRLLAAAAIVAGIGLVLATGIRSHRPERYDWYHLVVFSDRHETQWMETERSLDSLNQMSYLVSGKPLIRFERAYGRCAEEARKLRPSSRRVAELNRAWLRYFRASLKWARVKRGVEAGDLAAARQRRQESQHVLVMCIERMHAYLVHSP